MEKTTTNTKNVSVMKKSQSLPDIFLENLRRAITTGVYILFASVFVFGPWALLDLGVIQSEAGKFAIKAVIVFNLAVASILLYSWIQYDDQKRGEEEKQSSYY